MAITVTNEMRQYAKTISPKEASRIRRLSGNYPFSLKQAKLFLESINIRFSYDKGMMFAQVLEDLLNHTRDYYPENKKARRQYVRDWCRTLGEMAAGCDLAVPLSRTPKAPYTGPKCDPAYSRAKYLSFLESREWYRFRYEILRRDGPICALCRATGVPIQVDHIVPASVDWSRRLDPTNAQPLCRPCNVGKSNLYSDDWRKQTA